MTDNLHKVILDLCGGTGAWAFPYLCAGYSVVTITLPENDVRTYVPPRLIPPFRYHGILAAPVCRNFSHVLSEKLKRDYKAGMEIVNACLRVKDAVELMQGEELAFWALENPRGHLEKFLGAPAFTFQPWEFGDPWTKRTGIWGRFAPPATLYRDWRSVPKNPGLYIRPGRKKPNMVWLHKSSLSVVPSFAPFASRIKTDSDFRAVTPQGFAKAFFEANP